MTLWAYRSRAWARKAVGGLVPLGDPLPAGAGQEGGADGQAPP